MLAITATIKLVAPATAAVIPPLVLKGLAISELVVVGLLLSDSGRRRSLGAALLLDQGAFELTTPVLPIVLMDQSPLETSPLSDQRHAEGQCEAQDSL